MSSRIGVAPGLRMPQVGTRRPTRERRFDVALALIGRVTYSILLWLVVVAVVPMIWGWRPTVVVSGSMAPAIRDGDVVVAAPEDPIGLASGTIVLFRHQSNDELVAHRIVGFDADGLYITRGDNNFGADSTPVSPDEIEGVARMVVPWVGLPAHWLRTGRYLELLGFAGLIGICVWLGHRPRRDADPAGPKRVRRRLFLIGAGTVLILGTFAGTALAAFSAPTAAGGNSLASGVWGSLIALGGGDAHTCAIATDGAAWCWGENDKGQLGDSSTTDSSSPVRVVGTGGSGTLDGAAAMGIGREHSCVALGDTTVRCWGENAKGQLGNNSTTDRSYPVQVVGTGGSGTLSGVVEIDGGREFTCARLSNGTMRCWGENGKGQLGNNSTTDRRYPVTVVGPGGSGTLTGVIAISVGDQHACAALSDGSAWCWGEGSRGRLGNGSNADRRYPVQVSGAGPGAGVVDLAAGNQFTCGVTAGGAAYCWGRNEMGQLGKGSTGDSSTPAQVVGADGSGTLGGIQQITTGRQHACALAGSGSVYCWGLNSFGQLGDGSTTNRFAPVQVVGPGTVGTLAGVELIETGWYHSCSAVTDDGGWCWGRNNRGQLGVGSTSTGSAAPLQVLGL